MRLLWLTINSSYSHSSLTVPLAHAAAKDVSGWEWLHIQGTLKEDGALLSVQIAGTAPDLIAAPLYIFNREAVLDVLGRVRQLLPECRICVGGPECSGQGANDVLKQAPWLDFALRGEAEAIFPALLRNFPDTSDVPGVVTRDYDAGDAPIYEAWTSAPPPAGDEFYSFDRPFVQVESSRGCPNRCAFCTSGGTRLRFRPVEDVLREIAIVREHGVREIRMLDRTFNMPDQRAAELLKSFRTMFPDMRFHLEVHPASLGSKVREELLQAQAGQLHLEAGVQTLEPKALELMDRDVHIEKTLEGLEFLCGIPAIAVHTDIIAGCPGQSLAGIYRDVRRLMLMRPAELQLEIMKMLHGTPLRRRAAEYGMLFSPQSPYDVIATPSLPAHDIMEMRLLSRLVDCWYNSAALQEPFTAMLAENEGFLPQFLEYAQKRHGFDTGAAPALRSRFLWLWEYMQENSVPGTPRDMLTVQWLRNAMPVGEGPGAGAEYCRGIPPEAKLLCGTECRGGHGARTVKVAVGGYTQYFAYDRAIAPNHATAEYR